MVSGINHGPNLADDVTYSGTVAAAMEASLLGRAGHRLQPGGPRAPASTSAPPPASPAAWSPRRWRTRFPARLLLNVNVPAAASPPATR